MEYDQSERSPAKDPAPVGRSGQDLFSGRDGRPRHFGLWLQLAAVIGIWFFVFWLHANNTGLWFQGDAPRHALNGLFWQDFLRDFTLDGKAYALSYYARYPAINPAAYPPFFYLLEAGAFGIFGPNPEVAKSLVLVFLLLAGLYTFAWLHRWISPGVGWMAGLLFLTPGMTTWSHAIMLNVPATALMVGSLYHGRRWLEDNPRSLQSLHLYLTAGLVLLTVLTYFPGGVVLLVLFVWMVGKVGWKGPWGWRIGVVALAGVALLVPLIMVAARLVPTHVDWVSRVLIEAIQLASWTFYAHRMPRLFGPLLLMLATSGVLVAIAQRSWRREAWWLVVWIMVTYCSFAVLVAKEGRYILFMAPALVCLSSIAVVAAARWLAAKVPRMRSAGPAVAILIAVVMSWQLWRVWKQPVPTVRGFAEVSSFLEEVAPAEPVLYDGYHSGIFTFHVRASDPNFNRQVILGNKLLYTYALHAGWRERQFATSQEEVVQLVRNVAGCRWLAVEIGTRSEISPAMTLLRQTVQTPDFELVRSFPIEGPKVERVDVYRLLGAVEPSNTVRLPFPLVSSDTFYEVEPIPARR